MSSTGRLDALVGRVVVIGAAARYAVPPTIAWPLSLSRLSRLTPLSTRTLMAGTLRILGVIVVVAFSSFITSPLIDGLVDPVRRLIAVAAALFGFLAVTGAIPVLRRGVKERIEIARVLPRQERPR